MTLSAGKEVISYCNKCKQNLAHTIIVMKDTNTIGKVECKTCGAKHAYKDPSKVKATKVKSGTARKRAKTEQSVSDLWMAALNKSNAKSQDYSPKTCYKTGDIIEHKSFGPGIVEKTFDTNKMEVIFRHEIKVLIHNL
jgi:DNA-directed RNA polymerase subunit M/transcription elongation factor TFIIS